MGFWAWKLPYRTVSNNTHLIMTCKRHIYCDYATRSLKKRTRNLWNHLNQYRLSDFATLDVEDYTMCCHSSTLEMNNIGKHLGCSIGDHPTLLAMKRSVNWISEDHLTRNLNITFDEIHLISEDGMRSNFIMNHGSLDLTPMFFPSWSNSPQGSYKNEQSYIGKDNGKKGCIN